MEKLLIKYTENIYIGLINQVNIIYAEIRYIRLGLGLRSYII